VHGDGHQSRDFTYVGSVVAVISAAVLGGVSSPTPVNLAFGTRTDLMGVIALLEEILGRPVEVDHTDPRAGDVRHSQADDRRLRALFPDIEPIPLIDGLRATVDWIAGRHGAVTPPVS
jgi:UDP-glucose 4-epimerase